MKPTESHMLPFCGMKVSFSKFLKRLSSVVLRLKPFTYKSPGVESKVPGKLQTAFSLHNIGSFKTGLTAKMVSKRNLKEKYS